MGDMKKAIIKIEVEVPEHINAKQISAHVYNELSCIQLDESGLTQGVGEEIAEAIFNDTEFSVECKVWG